MLTVSHLTAIGAGGTYLLKDVSLSLGKGDRICLTGASGAGKSTLIRSIMGVGVGSFGIASGDIQVDGKSILNLAGKERRDLCGKTFGFIPQNSMTAFFPNVKIGKQISETYRERLRLSVDAAKRLAEETLRMVNLQDTGRILNSFPSQLSGGMLQRIAMSMILGMRPAYILADEPTSALDRSNRSLLIQLLSEYHDGGILFISHDVQAIRLLCPVTLVMEAGSIIEHQETDRLFAAPQEAWTRKFVAAAKRSLEENEIWKRLW